MAKQIAYDHFARQKIMDGISKLAAAVKVTFGPAGRNVLIEKKFGAPSPTKDGVTVSKEVELKDPFENCGARLANAAADKTNDAAGDGTTTAAIFVEALYAEGLKSLQAGFSATGIKRGIDKAVDVVVEEIKKRSRPVKDSDDYRNIALVASHFDEAIADLAVRAIEKAGKEGIITVEEGSGRETTLDAIGGLQFDKGWISPYFINKPDSMTAEYEDCYILLTDRKISNVYEIVPILEQVAATGKPILLVADEFEGEALGTIVVNRLRGTLAIVAVKAPAFGDRRKAILNDIALVTGAAYALTEDVGKKLENVTLEDLGRAGKVIVEKERTVIVDGKGDKKKIQARADELRQLIKKTTSTYDREKYEERLAKLQGCVCTIKVGGITEAEMKERKFRIEDAVKAVKDAAQEGVVPGGGVTFIRSIPAVTKLSKELSDDDERAGALIVSRALEAPLMNIAKNAGFDGDIVVGQVKESKMPSYGFDARTGEFGDMYKFGVIDPAMVCRLAIQNAASIAGTLLTSKTVITDLKDEEEAVSGATK